MSLPLLSIICPVYNEEKNISMFYERIIAVLGQYAGRYDYELIFTNNASSDSTQALVMGLHAQNERVKLITLSRNFGYQSSVLSGMTFAQGDATIVIDVDCEDPPELIPQFIEKWENGYDVVYGIRKKRQESEVVQAMRRLFYWLLHQLADSDVILHMAEFALITKQVRYEIINNKSTFPFLRTEIGYVGFKRIGIDYIRQKRTHGKTHYNFIGMSAFAIGGILSSSTYLLRLAAFIGAVLLPLNIILLLMTWTGAWLHAFPTLVTLDLMYIIFFMAVMCVYLARIYKNGVGRPLFIVDWRNSTYYHPDYSHPNKGTTA